MEDYNKDKGFFLLGRGVTNFEYYSSIIVSEQTLLHS
jgi:hypothetical protein